MSRRHREHAEQLERVLEGSLATDSASREVARLATLATTITEATSLEAPDPRFRAELRAQLLDVAAEERVTWLDRVRDRVDERTARWRYSARLAAATTVASTMLGTTGVAAAAQQALPGDVLYRVKLFTEDVQLAFAGGDAERGRLHLAFARERLEEVDAGLARLSEAEIASTLSTMDADSAVGAEELLTAAQRDEQPDLVVELQTFTSEQASSVTALIRDLPLGAVPAAEQSLEVLRRIETQINDLLADLGCEACADAAAAARNGAPGALLPGAAPTTEDCPDCAGVEIPGLSGGTDDDAPRPPETGDSGDTTVNVPDGSEPTGGPTPSDNQTSVRLLVPELPDPLDDAGQVIDDLLGTVLGDSALTEPVDELGNTLDTTVDELGNTVDSVLDPLLGGNSSTTSSPSPTSSPTSTGGLIDGLLGD